MGLIIPLKIKVFFVTVATDNIANVKTLQYIIWSVQYIIWSDIVQIISTLFDLRKLGGKDGVASGSRRQKVNTEQC